MQIDIVPVRCFAALGAAWEALEAEAPAASVFQSWSWVGCLAEERYPDPILLQASGPGGRVVGLALFNRRAGRLCLAESGEPALDAPFIEHNAPLVAAGPEQVAVTRALLRAAWRVGGTRRLVLGGVAPDLLAAAGGTPWRVQERLAPYVDLRTLPAGDWREGLSANTRYQLRRSDRRFAAAGGAPPAVAAAATEQQALDWFEAMAALHAESWQRRGQPGAFADDVVRRFHRALVARSFARGQLELLRVTAGPDLVLGYLYNFRRGGRVFAYQSGFRPVPEGSHEKPGLTSHALAIARALAAGDAVYDFLAGAHRYKLSLANAQAPLFWAELVPCWSPRGIAARMLRTLRRGVRPRPAGAGRAPA